MIETKFSKNELTSICQLLKIHGTDCATLVDLLRVAYRASSNDSIATFKHVRLMKEFGIIGDRDILCHTCKMEVIDRHAETCEEYKKSMASSVGCPDDHYDWNGCKPAVWMVDDSKISLLDRSAAKKALASGNRDDVWLDNEDEPHFTHTAREKWLSETFPDIDSEVRWNPFMGFLCESHIGSMKPYANRILATSTGYEKNRIIVYGPDTGEIDI